MKLVVAVSPRRILPRLVLLSMLSCSLMQPRVTYGQGAMAQSEGQTEQYSWTQERWNAKDPYARIRSTVDAALARQAKPEQLVEQYRLTAKKQPQSSQALFQWAYGSYRYSVQVHKLDRRSASQMNLKFAQLRSPHSYQYARMRFITEAMLFPSSRLKDLGLRLLKRNPNDVDVSHYMIDMLNLAKPQERATAFACAQRLVRLAPQRASSHASLGWVYFRSWLLNKNPADADKAVSAYQKYLQLAPPDDEFRSRAQKIIGMIHKGKL